MGGRYSQPMVLGSLKAVVSDAGLRAFPGEDLFSVLDLVLSKLKPFVTLAWFGDAPTLLHVNVVHMIQMLVG